MMGNPFAVKSPESLEPQMIADLFVDVFTDFPKVQENGHTFIHGARGTGKSMMLRFLEPAVQLAAKKFKTIADLPHFAVHVPLPPAQLNIIELNRLDKSAQYAFGEHLLVIHIAGRIADALSQIPTTDEHADDIAKFGSEVLGILKGCGWVPESDKSLNRPTFGDLATIFAIEFRRTFAYLNRLSLPTGDSLPVYKGVLATYIDLILPLIQSMRAVSFLPKSPVYIMLDDADNLSESLQRIVNTWVSLRTQKTVSLKISTQQRYKTYRTQDDRLIMAPHDYAEVNIDTIYTSRKDHYYNRVLEIVRRRLKALHGIDVDPESYFPVNAEQERAITEIAEELKQRWHDDKGHGYRAADDVVRYARPEYMRRLAGSSKSSSTYSYAGFKSMVDLSSGVIRWFLEPAASMHSEAVSRRAISDENVMVIPVPVQDQVIREWSESFLLTEFDKLKKSDGESANRSSGGAITDRVNGLYNLIDGLGKICRERLVDERATERKIFSILVSGQLPKELEEIFSLGIEWGYFQKSTIGSKEGSGRRIQFILSRRLAPYFRLDPSGYAAYLSVTPDLLATACVDPAKFVRDRLRMSDQEVESSPQAQLFQ